MGLSGRGATAYASVQRVGISLGGIETPRAAQQILDGELPFCDSDPGADSAKANAKLIREYA
jgi:hypothetical protein